MDLSVVEMFPTLQGEGSLTGTPAVFLRLSGCNMWSGLERHRKSGKGHCALWCDTQFAKGHKMDPEHIADNIRAITAGWLSPAVVVTGVLLSPRAADAGSLSREAAVLRRKLEQERQQRSQLEARPQAHKSERPAATPEADKTIAALRREITEGQEELAQLRRLESEEIYTMLLPRSIWGERFEAMGYPTMIVFNPQGEEVMRLQRGRHEV